MSRLALQLPARSALLVRSLAAGVDLFSLALFAQGGRTGGWRGRIAQLRISNGGAIESLVEVIAVLSISSCEFLGDASPGQAVVRPAHPGNRWLACPDAQACRAMGMKTIPLWLAFIASCIEQMAVAHGVRSDPLALRSSPPLHSQRWGCSSPSRQRGHASDCRCTT